MPYRIATTLCSEPKGSYAREALLNGLTLQDQGLPNAYQFGFIGASDTHNAASSLEEETYFSKVGLWTAMAACEARNLCQLVTLNLLKPQAECRSATWGVNNTPPEPMRPGAHPD